MKKIRLVLRPRLPEPDKPLDPAHLAAVLALAEEAIPPRFLNQTGEYENERLVPDEQAETRLHEHVGAQLDDQHELLLKERAQKVGHTHDAQRELEELSTQIQADASQRNARELAKTRDAFEKMVGEIAKIMTVEGSKELFRVIIRELAEMFF